MTSPSIYSSYQRINQDSYISISV